MSEIALPREKPTFEGLLSKRSACCTHFSQPRLLFPRHAPLFTPPTPPAGEWLHAWRTRYFKLYVTPTGPRLYFSADQNAAPHGQIDLRHCITVKSADEKTGKKFSFEVATTEQTFYMCADTDKAKDEWVGQLGRAIVLASPKAPAAFVDEVDEADDDDDDE